MSNYALLVRVIIKTGKFNRDCRCVKAVKKKQGTKSRQELQKVQEVESRGEKTIFRVHARKSEKAETNSRGYR